MRTIEITEEKLNAVADLLQDVFYAGRFQETTRDDTEDWRRVALVVLGGEVAQSRAPEPEARMQPAQPPKPEAPQPPAEEICARCGGSREVQQLAGDGLPGTISVACPACTQPLTTTIGFAGSARLKRKTYP